MHFIRQGKVGLEGIMRIRVGKDQLVSDAPIYLRTTYVNGFMWTYISSKVLVS